jgi:hypothetical protein
VIATKIIKRRRDVKDEGRKYEDGHSEYFRKEA